MEESLYWKVSRRDCVDFSVARCVHGLPFTTPCGLVLMPGDFEAYNPAGKVISTSRRRVYPGFASFQRVGGTPKAFGKSIWQRSQ